MSKNLKKYFKAYLVFLLSISHFSLTYSQEYKFVNRSMPSSYANIKSAIPKLNLSEFVSAEAYLPQGYSKDGSKDYTSYIQKALNANRNLIMPNFPILINASGLKLSSNSIIYLPDNCKIFLSPNAKDTYHMILIKNCENVQIINPRLVGDRAKHLGSKGQWGMGISIYNSSNIKLYNPDIRNCWGDGIYVGRDNPSRNNFDITIYSPQLHYNRRNGISIISGENIVLNSPVISNTNGASPMCGIDLEPNSNEDNLDNITINNPITFNNKYGILIYLKSLQGTKQKNVNVYINSPIDQYSINGVQASNFSLKSTAKSIKGNIHIKNPNWKNNSASFKKYNNQNLPSIMIDSK